MGEEFRLHFRFEHDFVEATIESKGVTYKCSADFTGEDGLSSLVESANFIFSHPEAQSISKWGFTQTQTWWVLDRHGSKLDINLVEFSEAAEVLQGEAWIQTHRFKKVGFYTNVDFSVFIQELIREFDSCDKQEYEKQWIAKFPSEELNQLKQHALKI